MDLIQTMSGHPEISCLFMLLNVTICDLSILLEKGAPNQNMGLELFHVAAETKGARRATYR